MPTAGIKTPICGAMGCRNTAACEVITDDHGVVVLCPACAASEADNHNQVREVER